VNLALAHEEAKRRGAKDARFAVCTSANNHALLDGSNALDGFRWLLKRPEAIHMIDVDTLLAHIEAVVPAERGAWAHALSARYRGI